MRVLLSLFVIALVVIGGSCAPTNNTTPTGEQLKGMLEEALLYYKTFVKISDPIVFPNSSKYDFRWTNPSIDAKCGIAITDIYGASKYKLETFNVDTKTLQAQLKATYPEIIVDGEFEMNGEVLNRKVSGTGRARAVLTNYTFHINSQFVDTKFEFILYTIPYVQIISLNETVIFDDLSMSFEGIKVHDMTKEELNNFIRTEFMKDLSVNKQEILRWMSEGLEIALNRLMIGKTLPQLTDWLKHHINNKEIIV